MNYNEFKQKYLGTFQDTDGAYGYQCVDLVKLILDKCYCLGKIGKLGNANQLPLSIPNMYEGFREVRGLNGIQPGDIIIRTLGTYGHVAIFDSYNSESKVVVLEQNGSGISSGAKIKGNEIRLKAYARDFFQCYLTNKKEEKADFSKQIEILNHVLTCNSEQWHDTTDKETQNTLHAMSEDIRTIIGKYT